MKTALRIAGLVTLWFVVLACVAQVPQTPNLKLNLPPQSYPNWGVLLNQNFTTLDTAVGGLQRSYSGTWLPAQLYQLGSMVLWNGVTYVSLIPNNLNLQPDLNPTSWAALGVPAALPSTGGPVGTLGYVPGDLISPLSTTCAIKDNFVTLGATATISLGSPTTLTLSAGVLTAAASGQTVVVHGAGASGGPLVSTITFANATTATLTVAAQTAVSGAYVGMGNDDTTAWQTCKNTAVAQQKSISVPTAAIPGACSLITKSLNFGNTVAFWLVGSQPNRGFNRSTICHALTEAFPALDFSGNGRSGVQNIAIQPVNGDSSNSLATAGILATPVTGGQSPLYFEIRSSYVQAGNTPGSGACIVTAIDQLYFDSFSCVSSYVGMVTGNAQGTTTAASKFYTKAGGFGNTLINFSGNSWIAGSQDTPLELEGSQGWVFSGNFYVVMGGVGTNNIGVPNGKIVEINQPGGFERNFLDMHGLRTENQSVATGVTAFWLTSANPLTACNFNANLATDASGFAIGGPGAMLHCKVVIGYAAAGTFFNNLGSMNDTEFTTGGSGSANPANFGTIQAGSFGFAGNTFRSWYTVAQVLAGVTNANSDLICQVTLCQWIGTMTVTNGGVAATGPISGSSLSISGGANIGNGAAGMGMGANFVRNSFNFGAATWSVTTGTCAIGTCITQNQPDSFGTNTATKIVTTAPVTFSDNNPPGALSTANSYITCAHAIGGSGSEPFNPGAFGLGIAQTLSVTPGWQWICSLNSRANTQGTVGNLILTAAAGETVTVDAFLTVFNTVGFFGSSFVYTGPIPPYRPTNGTSVTVPQPFLAQGNYLLSPTLSGVSASIGGSALAAGACASGTATISGATAGETGDAMATDGTTQAAYVVSAGGTAANTATVTVCAIVAGTPVAKTYNIRLFP